jgi:hypothetical protein
MTLAPSLLKLRLCLLKMNLQVSRIELDKNVTFVNKLIVGDVDLLHVRGDFRCDLGDVRFDVGVIRRFELPCVNPVKRADDHEDQCSYAADD